MFELNFYNEKLKENAKLLQKSTAFIDYISKDKIIGEMLGWVDLVKGNNAQIASIKKEAKKIQQKYSNFVVLGIGGSALGAKALFETFKLSRKEKINCHVCDNIDPDTFVSLLNSLDLKNTMFNVITKSGTTSETISQMLIVVEMLKSQKLELSEHFIITTETGSALDQFAKENNIKTFEVPKNVGGRFSVFSAVGMLPASVYGIDIEKLLVGAKEILENSYEKTLEHNEALQFAYFNYLNYKKGKKNLVIMPYSDRLCLIPDYFAQLWAESLGKKYNRKNKKVSIGTTPIKAIGVTDQHSQLQLYSEGENNKVFLFMKLKKNSLDAVVNTSVFNKYPYLNNVSLKKLIDAEEVATSYSLIKLQKPVISMQIEEINEKTIGGLLFFFQMTTAFMGEFLEINTYNQPGVEMGKIYTKAMLNDEKYQAQKQEIEEFFN